MSSLFPSLCNGGKFVVFFSLLNISVFGDYWVCLTSVEVLLREFEGFGRSSDAKCCVCM